MLALSSSVACGFITSGSAGLPNTERFVIEASSPAINDSGELQENIGIETIGGSFTPLLERGCKTPCSATFTFSTAVDNQDQIILSFYRGTSDRTTDAHLLGQFRISDIPPAPAGVPIVEITVAAVDGDLVIYAIDQATGDPYSVTRLEE
jgi:molecular chaperone DnaK (HSP70)